MPCNHPRLNSSKNLTAQQQPIVPSGRMRGKQLSKCHAAGVELGTSQHKHTKLTRHRVHPPQRIRIMQKYASGKSIVQISREENRNRDTVTKIVRSSEMQDFVRTMREQLYGLAFDAMKAVRFALQNNQDPRLAYKLLVDVGIVPSSEELAQAAMQRSGPEAVPLTPFQRAMLGMAAIAEQTSETST